ncbi:MAG: NAD(P)/FAD-dependent oxidoreductase [Desulfurococcaceae archaeon]
MKHDVIIIGAGPAGLSLAAEIKGLDVLIIEEHRRIGLPLHCTGLVGYLTKTIISRYSNHVIDKSYSRITFISEMSRKVIDFKEKAVFHINRPLLEETLASIAESRGHKLETGVRAKPYHGFSVKMRDKVMKPEVIVASDGASSLFRKVFSKTTPGYLIGIQVMARVENLDDESIFVIYSKDITGFFSWIVPLDIDKAIIGCITSGPVTSPGTLFHKISEKAGIRITSPGSIFGGLIPIHRPLREPVVYSKIVFHGDSVPLVKPYTGGGLFHIFNLSPLLAKCLENMDLAKYVKIYKKNIYGKLLVERSLVDLVRKNNLYQLPMDIAHVINKLGFLTTSDYDHHYKLLFKALGLMPLLPFVLTYNIVK